MKPVILLFISAAFLLLTSCEVDVPDTDVTPPKFSFKITGDGFDHTFDQDDDFEHYELYLKDGGSYQFIFSGSDEGGLKYLRWGAPGSPDSGIRVSAPSLPSGWSVTSRAFDEYGENAVKYEGNEADPVSGALSAGDFAIYQPYQDLPVTFHFIARDYGGLDENINTVEKYLKVFVGSGDDFSSRLVHIE